LERLGGVVAASDYLRGRFCEGLEDERGYIFVLPNSLNLAEAPQPVAMAGRERVILFAGRVVADKGADTFVAACARALPALPGWRAEMIGADRFGPDSPETGFIRELRPRAAAAPVQMLGYQPHDAVLAAMARSPIVVAPSRWPEPFGLVALEAMACGAALITSRRGALPEVAGDAALYADPDSPEALAEAIRALANDPARREALSAAGQARARGFDLPQAMRQLQDIRAAILARWPG
jgi:glycosyltransferase involved in cell wall biosynthesis